MREALDSCFRRNDEQKRHDAGSPRACGPRDDGWGGRRPAKALLFGRECHSKREALDSCFRRNDEQEHCLAASQSRPNRPSARPYRRPPQSAR